MDPLTITLSGGVGVAAGALIIYFIMINKNKAPKQRNILNLSNNELKKRINRSEIEKARRYMNTILLEKDLISSALTRVYEAEVDGKISRSERDELAARYKKRLREVEDKLGDTEITIEVGDLERLRDELMNLFERKIHQIDDRLQEASIKLDKMKIPIEPPKTLEMTIEEVEKKSRVKKTHKTDEIEVNDKVKVLREEVLEALARLEQMDIEK